MSKTPLTDHYTKRLRNLCDDDFVPIEFARKLERELSAVTAERERLSERLSDIRDVICDALPDMNAPTKEMAIELIEQRDRLVEAASKLTHYIKKARAGDSPSIHYFIISSIDDAIEVYVGQDKWERIYLANFQEQYVRNGLYRRKSKWPHDDNPYESPDHDNDSSVYDEAVASVYHERNNMVTVMCDTHCEAHALKSKLEQYRRHTDTIITLLEIVEETDEGRQFSPNFIQSCRSFDLQKIGEAITHLKMLNDET